MTSPPYLDVAAFEKLSMELLSNGRKYSSYPPGEETKQCFKIFLELGGYLLARMSQDLEGGHGEDQSEEEGRRQTEPEPVHVSDNEDLGAHRVDIKPKCGHSPLTRQSNLPLHTARGDPGLSYPCRECKFVAPSYVVLKGHEKLSHEKENSKICIKCGYKSFDKKEFTKHLKIVHPKKEKITQYR